MCPQDRRVGLPDVYQGLPGIRQTIDRVCTETELTQEQIEHVPSSLGTHNLLGDDHSYDGWCNYETWAVHLWLTDHQSSYAYCRDLAQKCVEAAPTCRQVREKIWSEMDAPRFLFADSLKDQIGQLNPLANKPSLFSDLLNSAIQEVDWHEIADAFLNEMQIDRFSRNDQNDNRHGRAG